MLSFSLTSHSNIPLYEQIYQEIRKDILSGVLPGKSRLPSTRGLAATLNVSRNTVDTAYYQLQAEGFIEAAPKSGFYVCDIQPDDHLPLLAPTESFPKSCVQKDAAKTTASSPVIDFSPHAIDISRFPDSVWRKLSRRALEEEKELFLLGDHYGDAPLRNAICNYVCLSRQTLCRPEQIITGAGVDYLLQMLSLVFRHLGLEEITMENPCYIQAANIFRSNSLRLTAGLLDEGGLTLSSIPERCPLVYVTPSHQYPMGTVMPFGRRKELLDWAKKGNRYIIEDDHDSEFRYKGRPIPSLQGMDDSSHVIYIGTFSRSIAPAIRAGYMILPPSLLPVYQKVCGHYSCTLSRLEQAILTRFIREGYFEKHISRMRKWYKAKHDHILRCLHPLLQQYGIRLQGENAGLHLTLTLPPELTETSVLSKASEIGVRLYGLHEYFLTSPAQSGILLGYSNLSLDEIAEGIQYLEKGKVFVP